MVVCVGVDFEPVNMGCIARGGALKGPEWADWCMLENGDSMSTWIRLPAKQILANLKVQVRGLWGDPWGRI